MQLSIGYKYCGIVVLVWGVLLAGMACAQNGRGGVTGTVQDATGAAVRSANIDLLNIGKNLRQSTISSSTSVYSFMALVPGAYNLTITSPGFETEMRKNILIGVDQVTSINVGLRPGQVTQVVSVDASVELPNLADSTVGQTLSVEIGTSGRIVDVRLREHN